MQFVVYRDLDGDRWQLQSANGTALAESTRSYASEQKCLAAVARVRRGCAAATVRVLRASIEQ